VSLSPDARPVHCPQRSWRLQELEAAGGRRLGGAFASAELVLSEGAADQQWVAVVRRIGGELHGGGVAQCTVMMEVLLDRGGGLACAFGGPHGGGGRIYLRSCSLCLPSSLTALRRGAVVGLGGGRPKLGRGDWLCRRAASGEGGHVRCS
jgi:hypothetical protein